MPASELTSFSLRDIAGEHLIQDTPYPVVAPRNFEMLAMIVQFARAERVRILPLGMGSSFDTEFQLSSSKIIAVLSAGLSGIQKLPSGNFRVLSGTPLTRLFRADVAHIHKTLGGQIAGVAGIHDDVQKALWSRCQSIDVMNGDGKLLRFAGPSAASATDPGLGQLMFGSQGRLGIIVSVELRGPLPLDVILSNAHSVGAVLSPNEALVKRSDLARIFDPDSLFSW